MKKAGLGRAAQGKGLQDRLKIAERRLRRLLEDVERDRDRLVAEPLTLRFVWHQEGHPHQGKLWDVGYGHGCWYGAGHFFDRMALPINKESTPSDCRIYLVGGDGSVCECFTQHCREAEAILGRMSGDCTRNNWAEMLFDTLRGAVNDEGRAAVEWRENEEPDRPDTLSGVAELRDVFEWTRVLLKAFGDGAELRQQSPEGLSGDHGNPTPGGELSKSVAAVRAAYEWAISTIPGADEMTISQLFHAIQSHPDMKSEFLERLPNNDSTFGTYLRRAGIQRYNKSGSRVRRSSRRPRT
jgi:hypothetical protein